MGHMKALVYDETPIQNEEDLVANIHDAAEEKKSILNIFSSLRTNMRKRKVVRKVFVMFMCSFNQWRK